MKAGSTADDDARSRVVRVELSRWVRVRILLFVVALLAVLAGVALRAYRLQIDQGSRYRLLAEKQYRKRIELQPRRGAIFDRHGAALALSVDTDSVAANPRVIADRAPQVARDLAAVLGLDRHRVQRQLESRRYFAWLKRRISPAEARQVERLAIGGVFLQAESKRYYPNRGLAASVLGFSGLDGHGLEGVERSLDTWLRGSSVQVASLRDALGRSVLSEGVKHGPAAGHDVVLSLDKVIQFETERALEQVYQRVSKDSGWVAAIVMDPKTGDVLAMATLPSYDPNRFEKAGPRQWRNQALVDTFEPGSTLKVFSIAGALEAGVTRPNEMIDCENGRWRVGGHVIHDSKPYDRLSVTEVLTKSSNIGVSKLAARLGRSRLYRILKRFGFGERTGVPLSGEPAGVLRRPRGWSDVGLANIAFGQGLTATVLQVTRALAAIGNDGVLMRPRIVLRVRDRTGHVVQEIRPQGVRVLSREISARMLEMMRGVTKKGGTGEAAALDRYTSAGKTGTAQKVDTVTGRYGDDKWVSSFVGLVPATEPRLAIAVVVNEPEGRQYHGGDIAGPVFRQIASRSLRYLGVIPDIPSTPKAGAIARAKRRVSSESERQRDLAPPLPGSGGGGSRVVVPDFTGMSLVEVLSEARERGIGVRLYGSGRAVSQSPGPGTVAPQTICRVSLQPPG